MKKILIITYAFPPSAIVGVYRTLKYCKYLPSFGWSPIILTINAKNVVCKDESLLKELPKDINIVRTIDFDPLKWFKKAEDIHFVKAHKDQPSSEARTSVEQTHSWLKKIITPSKKCIKTLITTPDSHIFWVPFAVLKGIYIILTNRVDVIYSTSPPHSSHVIAFILSKIFRKKYILDFRDPWGGVSYDQNKSKLILSFEMYLKNVIVRNASKIITASKGIRDETAEEFRYLSEERFSFITNGYDPDDFKNLSYDRTEPVKFTITHTGTIYQGIADDIFAAIKSLLISHPEIAKNLQINLLGDVGKLLPDNGLNSVIKYFGHQPHTVALKHLFESDLLLILTGDDFSPFHLPAKTFEYLYTEKPILAITKEGDLSEILLKSGLGFVVAPKCTDKLQQKILELYEAKYNGTLKIKPDSEYIRNFERKRLTEKLVSILNQL